MAIKVSVIGTILPNEKLDDSYMRFLFPRGFTSKLVKNLLNEKLEGIDDEVEILKRLYEIAYGKEEEWDDQVKLSYEVAKNILVEVRRDK